MGQGCQARDITESQKGKAGAMFFVSHRNIYDGFEEVRDDIQLRIVLLIDPAEIVLHAFVFNERGATNNPAEEEEEEEDAEEGKQMRAPMVGVPNTRYTGKG